MMQRLRYSLSSQTGSARSCIRERRLILYNEGKEELDDAAVERLKEELENDDNKPSQAELSNYLTFYESLFILLEGKAIS